MLFCFENLRSPSYSVHVFVPTGQNGSTVNSEPHLAPNGQFD